MILQRSKISNQEAYKFTENILTDRVENWKSIDGQRKLNDLILKHSLTGLVLKSEPNAFQLKRYESSPSMWLFDDTETEHTFIVYSDCLNKNFWKGTSFEYVVARKPCLYEAFVRLIEFLTVDLQ